MKRLVIILLTLILLAAAVYLLDQYWIHRYDSLIAGQAARHQIDPDLVWSLIYEESYFRPWKKGDDGEIGLMQVTSGVVQDWTETGASASQPSQPVDTAKLLSQPQANIQIGCWYLGKFSEKYRNVPGREARMLAAYNAGDRRVIDWSRVPEGAPPLTEQQFIERIDILSTRSYVTSILRRYREVKSARGR